MPILVFTVLLGGICSDHLRGGPQMTEPTAMPRPPAKEPFIRRFLTFRRGPWRTSPRW